MVEANIIMCIVVSLEREMEDVLKIDGRVSGLKGNKMGGGKPLVRSTQERR